MNVVDMLLRINASFVSAAILIGVTVVVVLVGTIYFTTRSSCDSIFKSTKNGREKRRDTRMACNYIMEIWDARNLSVDCTSACA